MMKIQRKGSIVALATIVAAAVFFHLRIQKLQAIEPADVPIEELPMQLAEWEGRDTAGLSIRSQEILQLSRFVKREYSKDGKSVILYIGYWQTQTGEYQAAKHSPALCLPANGWNIERLGEKEFALPGPLPGEVSTKRILGEHRGNQYLFYYWFFTGTENYSEEWRSLVNISLQKLFSGRSDGGIVEISVPVPSGMARDEAEQQAALVLEDFMEALYPELRRLIETAEV